MKDRVIEAVRFSLLSKEYLEGLEDDMVMRICPGKDWSFSRICLKLYSILLNGYALIVQCCNF